MPTFARRSAEQEWMDDLSIVDERLHRALHDLRAINQWLGGYSSLWSAVGPYLADRAPGTVRILDIGTGLADGPAYLVRRAEAVGCTVQCTAVDTNPATIGYARRWLDEALPPHLRGRITLRTGNLFSLSFDADAFHLSTASLFLHHLDDHRSVQALRRMDRFARDGFVVNDLHRSRMAYYGLRVLVSVMPVSDMVRHDGPLSVARGFHKNELEQLAREAGCSDSSVTWHWAFRWILSSIKRERSM